MNHSEKNETEAIRSDIDVTRRRMDDTMDALGDRLQPRHLLDEILGFLRGSSADGENRLKAVRDKVTSSADTAIHAVTDTIKENPMPALLIGAGVAWMIYESRRDKSMSDYDDEHYARRRREERNRYDPDTHYDRPLEYPASTAAEREWDEARSTFAEGKEKLGDKVSAAADQVKDKLANVGEAAREKVGALRERAGEKLHAVKERAGEMTDRVKQSTREAYSRTRERVTTTADQHPIEVGLVALAAGVIAGLALPTPNVVNRTVGPTADRLRNRTREMGNELVEKGKRVARAATTAIKEEAEAQGLTPDRLGEKAAATAERGMEAGKETAKREGLAPGAQSNPSGTQPNDPSVARPAV